MSFVLYQLTGILVNLTRCGLDTQPPLYRAFLLKKVVVGDPDAAMETYKMQHIPMVHGQKIGRHEREGKKEKPNEESNLMAIDGECLT